LRPENIHAEPAATPTGCQVQQVLFFGHDQLVRPMRQRSPPPRPRRRLPTIPTRSSRATASEGAGYGVSQCCVIRDS
jgi:hypothetical protein